MVMVMILTFGGWGECLVIRREALADGRVLIHSRCRSSGKRVKH